MWQLKVNVSKTSVPHCGVNNVRLSYSFNSRTTESAEFIRDLGVVVDSGVTFDAHVNNVVLFAYLWYFLAHRLNITFCTLTTICNAAANNLPLCSEVTHAEKTKDLHPVEDPCYFLSSAQLAVEREKAVEGPSL